MLNFVKLLELGFNMCIITLCEVERRNHSYADKRLIIQLIVLIAALHCRDGNPHSLNRTVFGVLTQTFLRRMSNDFGSLAAAAVDELLSCCFCYLYCFDIIESSSLKLLWLLFLFIVIVVVVNVAVFVTCLLICSPFIRRVSVHQRPDPVRFGRCATVASYCPTTRPSWYSTTTRFPIFFLLM